MLVDINKIELDLNNPEIKEKINKTMKGFYDLLQF
jgi:hypothetical protein